MIDEYDAFVEKIKQKQALIYHYISSLKCTAASPRCMKKGFSSF